MSVTDGESIQPDADETLPRIGEVLAEARLITPEQTQAIQQYCREHNARFGEAAVELGYIDKRTLDQALAEQFGHHTATGDWGGEPVAFTQPQSREAEDYRSIRNALTLRWFKHPQGEKTLAVISPERDEGRSRMAANLAVCFAQVGFRTLLVDADMRHPRQHELFNIDPGVSGLSSLLAERTSAPDYYPIPSIPTLSLLPAGGIPPNPQELLLRGVLERLVEDARERFEMILFDTPAATVGSDFQLIGAAAGGALLVSKQAVTRTKLAKRQVEQCRGFGIRIVGSAMLGAS